MTQRNEHSLPDPFSGDLFHEVRMPPESNSEQWAFHSNLGSLTVLDRMTGFGYRDAESGFRDPSGRFWLASGGCDVRRCGAETIDEAIEWVKANANTCVGAQI